MSCQINVIASIVDTKAIKHCLFSNDKDRHHHHGNDNWLSKSCLSMSPTGDLIAIAFEKKLVILTAKWDSNAALTQFHVTYSGTLDASDTVTAVLCLPIVSLNQNVQVGQPDWTCIAVGFESGHVRFFTDDCSLLLSEQLHNERVYSLKCQSQHSSRPDLISDIRPEELYVQYLSNICVLSGVQLFGALRSSRSHLARVSAAGYFTEPNSYTFSTKKWAFVDQAVVQDVEVVGLDLANTFDHLFTASTCGGFDTRYRAMAPHNTLVMAVGAKPYVGFHYAMEGGTQPVLSDVAKAVANRLKSALPGWLMGSKQQLGDKLPSVSVQPAEAMGCRFGLCDIPRVANRIVLSPDKRLSVVTDSLGRVALIDNHTGIALRLWKGYRDAQCAFVQVPDENFKHHRNRLQRIALFLIIYCPKKGTIEIWAMQQGPKVVTFTASKNGHLVYATYNLLGFGAATKSKHTSQFACIFIDPDGVVKEIVVPFHCALTEKNSKRARDMHLFKRLKQFLRSADYDLQKLYSEVVSTCDELKTNEVRLRCLEMLMNNKHVHPDVLAKVVSNLSENLNDTDDPSDEVKQLAVLCSNLRLLIQFYLYINNIESEHKLDEENCNLDCNKVGDITTKVGTKLPMGEKDMNNLQRLLDLSTAGSATKVNDLKVSFHDDDGTQSVFTDYLSVFRISCEKYIGLKEDVPEDKLYRVSELFFKNYVASNRYDVSDFQIRIVKTTVTTVDLLKMMLCYWVNRPLTINTNLEDEMRNFSAVLYSVCQITDAENLCVGYNEISPFWKSVRDILADSPRPFPALTAAILCKGVAQKIESDKESQQYSATSLEDDSGGDRWEKLSQDCCQWTLLIGKLEDVSLLNVILANKPTVQNSELPKLSFEKTDISLKYILLKGKGSVSELVARWLTSWGIDPKSLVTDECLTAEQSSLKQCLGPEEPQVQTKADQAVIEYLSIIRKQFPYSLHANALLTNMCWEYALAWDWALCSGNFSYLEAAIRCLKLVPDVHIKQGLFSLLWSAHLRLPFEAVCKLINKVGKLPKERLCRQDTGMSECEVRTFLSISTDFLDVFMDVVQQSYSSEKKMVKYESIWDGGRASLTELALQQTNINYDLLHLHYQLSLVMQMMTQFQIKHLKPINSLFDGLTVGLFFTDLLQKQQITAHSSDAKVTSMRIKFLTKVINASVDGITSDYEGVVHSQDHVLWMSKCLSLAVVWGLNADMLRRIQVVKLFVNGFDPLGEELLSSVSEVHEIGPELLDVAGKRFKLMIESSPDLMDKIVTLSPSLLHFLNTLNGEWCSPSTLKAITNLTILTARCIGNNGRDSRFVSLLLDTCFALQESSV